MSDERYFCAVEDHGEDITELVLNALRDGGDVVYRRSKFGRRRTRRRFFVYCSQGHLNIIELE